MKEKYEITQPDYQSIANNLSKVARLTTEEIGAGEINYALLQAKKDGYDEGFEAARTMLQKEYL